MRSVMPGVPVAGASRTTVVPGSSSARSPKIGRTLTGAGVVVAGVVGATCWEGPGWKAADCEAAGCEAAGRVALAVCAKAGRQAPNTIAQQARRSTPARLRWRTVRVAAGRPVGRSWGVTRPSRFEDRGTLTAEDGVRVQISLVVRETTHVSSHGAGFRCESARAFARRDA